MSMHKGLIGKSEGGASVRNEQYLHQYIERKTDNRGELGISKSMEKRLAIQTKLTFDGWWKTQVLAGFNDDPVEYIRNVWNAAQEQCNCYNEPTGSKENM